MSEEALRYNAGKISLTMITPQFLEELGSVMEMGAKKYARDNWKKGMSFNKVIDSLERHILAFRKGESWDPESGRHHMGHVAANAMFLLHYDTTLEINERFDDRDLATLPPPPKLERSEKVREGI